MMSGGFDDSGGRDRSVAATVTLVVLVVFLFCVVAVRRRGRLPVPPAAAAAMGAGSLMRGIDPNTATVDELMTLRGIGPSLARRIVAYRSARQASAAGHIVFTRAEDLDAVHGIGPKTVARLRPWLTFDDGPAGRE